MISPQTESDSYYAVHFPHNLIRNLRKTFAAFFSTSLVINLLLTMLAGRISAFGLFCKDLAFKTSGITSHKQQLRH